MPDTLEAVDLETWLDDDLACEGAAHPYGAYGHTPDAPAEYRVIAPCCGKAVHQCATRAVTIMQTDFTSCLREQGGCGATFATAELKVVPI